jgi:hypothetical protein
MYIIYFKKYAVDYWYKSAYTCSRCAWRPSKGALTWYTPCVKKTELLLFVCVKVTGVSMQACARTHTRLHLHTVVGGLEAQSGTAVGSPAGGAAVAALVLFNIEAGFT